jgi:hypothetical protein
MTTLTERQVSGLMYMLRQLETEIDNKRVEITSDSDSDCPATAHAKIKRAIQSGSEPFIIGDFAIVRV